MCHNHHHTTQTDQEPSRAICVEKLASNRMSFYILLFLAAQESENSHSFLTFGDTQREHYMYPSLLRTYHNFWGEGGFLTISKLTYYKNRRHCCS